MKKEKSTFFVSLPAQIPKTTVSIVKHFIKSFFSYSYKNA